MKSGYYTLLSFIILSLLLGFVFIKWFDKSAPFSIQLKAGLANYEIRIENALAEGKRPICDKYRFIELNFTGDQSEKLRAVTNCISAKNKKDVQSILIPFQHIYKFSSQTGEFTTETNTKIYISNHQKAWPKKWTIKSAEFFNSKNDHFFVSEPQGVLDATSWIQSL